ncbi:enoyl-CoA hydratase/isomerase family protein [Shimazuella alba]|uniref:Enoyl-CoA hydratase/isomerase family protein n=1 Tax=Shimazuella alba TaxID=2690964 RepID=A0A6I4VR04_9BACL|nr:enoyl-CoA hydratase-related protein [Shimazuella alba]MXQ52828.1 enoyl-CoA hydratase/isomerase family protein [Shimazuella alba]
MTSWNCITLEVEQSIGILTLSRTKVLNALNQQMLTELTEALHHVESLEEIKVLIVTGAGQKAFAAGADISELRLIENAIDAEKQALLGQTVFDRLENMPIPVIMAVNGFALGGGCELALAGDVIFAAESAKFGQPEINLGTIPGYGGTQRLSRAIGEKNAKYYLFSGELFSSEEAWRLGLIQKVLPNDQLLPEAKAFAKKLAKLAPIALQYVKKSIHNGLEIPLDKALQLEATYFGLTFQTADRLEGMDAFLEKRKPTFRGE